jgi:uncharacterized membrane protein YgcG
MALDGTCIPISSPLDTASATLGLPDGTVNDVVPSPQNQCADVECIVAAPGYNAGNDNNGGGGHGGSGGGGGGSGGGGGHGR